MRNILLVAVVLSAAATHAQLLIGPSVRAIRLDNANKYKLGFGVELSGDLGPRLRWTLAPYWTPWEDKRYSVNMPIVAGSSTTFDTRFEYTHWGLNADLEWSHGSKGWFWITGLGLSSYHLRRTDVETNTLSASSGEPSIYEVRDRLLLLDAGLGKRWSLGNGEVRAAFTAGALGYNFDNADQRPTILEVMGLSLGYQFGLGKKH